MNVQERETLLAECKKLRIKSDNLRSRSKAVRDRIQTLISISKILLLDKIKTKPLVIKTCKKCGVSHKVSSWFKLPMVGYQISGDIDGEMRNCLCNSTLFYVTRMSDYAKQVLIKNE